MIGLLALVYGLIEGGHRNEWTSPLVVGSLVGGLLVLVVFVRIELRVENPSFDVRLFRSGKFTGASVAVMLTFFSLSGSMFYTSFYLQGALGQTPFEAGLNLIPVAVGVLLGAPVSAALVRKLGLGPVVATAMMVAALTFLAYTWLDLTTAMPWFWLLLTAQGLAMGSAVAPTTEAIMAVLPPDRTGAGSAVNNSMRQIGGVLGVAILGSLLSSVYAADVAPDLEALPAPVKETAEQSAEATRQVAAEASLPELVGAANDSFLYAMHVTSVVGAWRSSEPSSSGSRSGRSAAEPPAPRRAPGRPADLAAHRPVVATAPRTPAPAVGPATHVRSCRRFPHPVRAVAGSGHGPGQWSAAVLLLGSEKATCR